MYTIYHNPRCSKSRQTLEILRQHTPDIRIVAYLDEGVSEADLKEIFSRFDGSPGELVRAKDVRKDGLAIPADDELPGWLAAHIRYLERPIVDDGKTARSGRPPENILAFFAD